jgi:hypothetical protein
VEDEEEKRKLTFFKLTINSIENVKKKKLVNFIHNLNKLCLTTQPHYITYRQETEHRAELKILLTNQGY